VIDRAEPPYAAGPFLDAVVTMRGRVVTGVAAVVLLAAIPLAAAQGPSLLAVGRGTGTTSLFVCVQQLCGVYVESEPVQSAVHLLVDVHRGRVTLESATLRQGYALASCTGNMWGGGAPFHCQERAFHDALGPDGEESRQLVLRSDGHVTAWTTTFIGRCNPVQPGCGVVPGAHVQNAFLEAVLTRLPVPV